MMMSDKRVLITGGAGMIGSALAHLLVRQGAAVRIVDAMLPLYGGNLFNLDDISGQIEFIKGDIRDAELMHGAVTGVDYIVDLAAQVSYVLSNRDPLLDLDINCRGHLILLEACRQVNSGAKIVFASSRFVYGATLYNPVDESHPTNCTSVYGIHKLSVEKYCEFYRNAFGLATTCVRIANPYGPRQQMKHSSYGIVNWFIRLAMDGQPLTIYGDGQQIRDYIYVEDLAEAILALAITPESTGQVFNLGCGEGTQFREMVGIIAELLPGTKISKVPWPQARYFVETGDYVSDISRMHAVTGWRPKTNLREGIDKTIAFYEQNKDQYWESKSFVTKA